MSDVWKPAANYCYSEPMCQISGTRTADVSLHFAALTLNLVAQRRFFPDFEWCARASIKTVSNEPEL